VPAIGEGEMTEADYLADRAMQELRAAILAFDVRVRSAHLAMVDAYTLRLREAKRGRRESVKQ
jgi:hypothetical protein